VSRLRARCPDCRTLTAVAIGPDYECHSCGREFRAGLVRVPRAWGTDGEAMAEAAFLSLPYPETAVIEEDSLPEQNAADTQTNDHDRDAKLQPVAHSLRNSYTQRQHDRANYK
jgi:hypothetical protein